VIFLKFLWRLLVDVYTILAGRRPDMSKERDRETTTTRVYVDTVRTLRILAEGRNLSALDYLDVLVKEAAEREGPQVLARLAEALGIRGTGDAKKK
jgi:hypothetical protein